VPRLEALASAARQVAATALEVQLTIDSRLLVSLRDYLNLTGLWTTETLCYPGALVTMAWPFETTDLSERRNHHRASTWKIITTRSAALYAAAG